MWENTVVVVEGLATIEFVDVETNNMSPPFSSEKTIFLNCVDCQVYGMIFSKPTIEGAGAPPPTLFQCVGGPLPNP